MFKWIMKLFCSEPARSEGKEYEALKRKQIEKFIKDNPDISDSMKTLAKDFKARSLEETKGGSSSSPLSSS